MIGPAEATRNLCHLGLERNSLGAPVTDSPGFSPAILTYPPSGKRADAVIGIPVPKSDQARAEAHRERFDLDLEELGDQEMSQFVNDDNDAKHEEREFLKFSYVIQSDRPRPFLASVRPIPADESRAPRRLHAITFSKVIRRMRP